MSASLLSRRQTPGALAGGILAPAQTRRHLNVPLIAVDDLNSPGCNVDPVVTTPNIDRAYCYPLCNSSRTSLLGSLRSNKRKVLDNNTPPRTYINDAVMLPEYFRQNGYFTARAGKIPVFASGRQPSEQLKAARGKMRAKAGDEEGPDKLVWLETDNADENDSRTARRIAQLMEQNWDEPFSLGAGFHKPYLPWVEKKMTELDRKRAICASHAATSFMDAQVGYLLNTFDKLKLWDNTVVLLFGDHGWHLNEHHGLWHKMTVFEEAVRAPRIVAAPGKRRGEVCPRLAEWIDFYPTSAELAGLPKPKNIEGTSFLPLLDNAQQKWKKASYTVVRHGKTIGRRVRTKEYRNLARDPKQSNVIREWQKVLANPELAKPGA